MRPPDRVSPAQAAACNAGKLVGALRSRRWSGAAPFHVVGAAVVERPPAPAALLRRQCGGGRRGEAGRPAAAEGRAEPGVDQVELAGGELEALAATARDHEVAEAGGEQVG